MVRHSPVELVLDESPRRAVTSVNVRFDAKELFDEVQARLCVARGRRVHQWEVFDAVLAAALENALFESGLRVDRKRLSAEARLPGRHG